MRWQQTVLTTKAGRTEHKKCKEFEEMQKLLKKTKAAIMHVVHAAVRSSC